VSFGEEEKKTTKWNFATLCKMKHRELFFSDATSYSPKGS